MNTDSKEKRDLSQFPVALIKQAPENESIYDDFGIANEDDYQLVESIRAKGIMDPLVITSDNYLLSGHRRLAAAKHIGLRAVPVRKVDDVRFIRLTTSSRLDLLRSFNQQREKSTSEKIREAIVGIDPDMAFIDLKMHDLQRKALGSASGEISIKGVKKRSKITTLQFLRATEQAIESQKNYWPLTVRRIHYLLLNDPPLRHDKKPSSQYANDKASYKSLTNLLSRARLTGQVPITAIEDSTRPIQLGGGFENVGSYIEQETKYFLTGYNRNLQVGQPHHVEIVLEKNALRTVIEPIAREYCIPITTARGYASFTPRYEVFSRYKDSGKKKLIILYLTDFDPDGDEIAASFSRSLRDDFGIKNIQSIKVALTAEDVEEYDLPSDMDAKVSSPNYKKFFALYKSNRVVELDAAPVELLQEKLRDAIESVIDMDEYRAQIDIQNREAVEIQAHRKVVFDAMGSNKK
jgi:hypothetical protein